MSKPKGLLKGSVLGVAVIASLSMAGFVNAAIVTLLVLVDPTSLVFLCASFQADNYNLLDFATININNAAGTFTETGTLELTQWVQGSTTLLSTDTGLRNGIAANSYGIYLTFSATGSFTTGAFQNGGLNVGAFSTISYTMLGDPGNLDTVTPAGVHADVGGNDIVIATGSLATGGPNQVSVIGSINQPGADVLLNISKSVPPDFFTLPVDLSLQEDSFTNTTTVVTVTPNGPNTIIQINGGGGNGTFAATPTPEPASIFVLGVGLLGIGGIARRRRKV